MSAGSLADARTLDFSNEFVFGFEYCSNKRERSEAEFDGVEFRDLFWGWGWAALFWFWGLRGWFPVDWERLVEFDRPRWVFWLAWAWAWACWAAACCWDAWTWTASCWILWM